MAQYNRASTGWGGVLDIRYAKENPVLVYSEGSCRAVAISCGREHTAVLMEDGRLLLCGNNNHYQLGA